MTQCENGYEHVTQSSCESGLASYYTWMQHSHFSSLSLSPSSSILRTWRWACEDSESRFFSVAHKPVFGGIQMKQRDTIWHLLGQWLIIRHSWPPTSRRKLPQTLRGFCPCLFFSVSSKWWLCYIHQFFLLQLQDSTKETNWIKQEENSLYICIRCVWSSICTSNKWLIEYVLLKIIENKPQYPECCLYFNLSNC